MRSADLKAGLIRVATFGRRVEPDVDAAAMESPRASHWRLVVAGCVLVILLLVGAWYAGRESAGLEAQRISREYNQLAQQAAAREVALEQQRVRADQLETALHASGKTPVLALQTQLRQQLLQAQAQANQYKAIIDREHQAGTENSRLVAALANPGARLLALKDAEGADATGYALVIENSGLVFVGSNLPQPAEGHQFQVWLLRRQEPKIVSAGTFTPDGNDHALLSFDQASVVTDITGIEVTEEPQGGSEAPSGAKLLESSSPSGSE